MSFLQPLGGSTLVLLVAIVPAGAASAQDVAGPPATRDEERLVPASSSAVSESAADDFSAIEGESTGPIRPEELLATWIAEALPTSYEKKEDWGRTRRTTVGLESSGRGLDIRLQRKQKDVPHGLWKHYRVRLGEGVGTPLVDVENLRALEPGRAAATIYVVAPLESWARTRLYRRGIHLGTYTAEGRSRVHVHLECELAVRVENEEGWPVLVVEPHVTSAKVRLRDFHLERISNADGPLVRELGSVVERIIEDELKPAKLTRKLNRAIDKKKDRLRLDSQELVASGWSELIGLAAE